VESDLASENLLVKRRIRGLGDLEGLVTAENDIASDAKGPHVRGEAEARSFDNLRCYSSS